MKFKTVLSAALCLLSYLSNAQTTEPQIIVNGYQVKLCAGSQVKIPVQISGKFNSGNRFSVTLSTQYNNKLLATYDAVLEGGNLVFTIPDDLPESESRLYFQISTTSPVIRTSPISANWYTRGKISISRPRGEPDTLNAGVSYLLNVDMNANNPVTFTLSDSSVREISPNGYQQSISLLASKPADIFIVKAVNSCSVPVPFSGRVPLAINPISIIPGKINTNTALCAGNEIELSYAVSGGTIPESAKFRLRFVNPYANENEQMLYEVPAQKKSDGVLVARIPENLAPISNVAQVAILVDKPGLVSSFYKYLSIYRKPSASFRSQSDSARVGDVFTLWLNVSGPEPYTVELNNGNSYVLDGNLNINVYPVKTETYSIRSLRTACGVTTDLPKQTVVATVAPGIAINAPEESKRQLCENQKVRLAFITNTNLTASTKVIVEGITYNNVTYQFEGKIVNDSIEFFLPHSPAELLPEGYFKIKMFRIKTNNPTLVSRAVAGFNVQGIPRVTYESANSRTLTGAGYFNYALHVSGGTPYLVKDEKGGKTPAEYTPMAQTIFVPATGAYGPATVSNGCYSNSDLTKVNLTVNPYTSQVPAIVVHPPTQKYLCDPDSIEVYFEALGNFGAGNQFQITSSENTGEIMLTVSNPGRYKVRPSQLYVPGYMRIVVRATNPALQASAGISVITDTNPRLLYPGELAGTQQKPRIFGIENTPYINTQLNSYSPYIATFSDGVKDYHFEQALQTESFRPVFPRSTVTPYTLKSLSNACGTTDVNLTTYLYWAGYSLSIQYFQENRTYCIGEELVVPFSIERGSAPAGTTYHLQISKDLMNFTTVASSEKPEDFRYMIPDSMEGEYSVRIATDHVTASGAKSFFVNKTPSASISLSDEVYSEIDYGQPVYIDYKLAGGGPWELIQGEEGNFTATSSPFTKTYTPEKGQVFRINSVSNKCGYGSASGDVSVRVRPKIVTFQPEKNVACNGEGITVKYQIGGDIPAGEKVSFFLKNANGSKFELAATSNAAGTLTFPIPATIPGDYYQLVCYITNSEISESRQITIGRTPDLEITGNTIINAGEAATLLIRSVTPGNTALNVTLSDGTEVTHNNWGPNSFARVTPGVTTTYTIASATGVCGQAKTLGTATVTVNPPSAKTIRVTGTSNLNLLCEKDTLLVYYTQTGTFSAENQFTVHINDTQGKAVQSLPATGKASPLRITVPAGFSGSELYRIRLTASDANVASSDFQQLMQFATKAGASFASSSTTPDEEGLARIPVLLTGTGPWRYTYGNDLGSAQRSVAATPDTLLLTSREPTAYFRLLSVSNGCGAGVIREPSMISVAVVLGLEQPASEQVTLGPNPTSGIIILNFKNVSEKKLSLYNLAGTLIWTKRIKESFAEVDVQQYPSGSYLMKIEHPEGAQTFRFIKD